MLVWKECRNVDFLLQSLIAVEEFLGLRARGVVEVEVLGSPADLERIRRTRENTKRIVIFQELERGQVRLTTVQHKGQNHHIRSRTSSRKTTSSETSTMVPSNCGGKR